MGRNQPFCSAHREALGSSDSPPGVTHAANNFFDESAGKPITINGGKPQADFKLVDGTSDVPSDWWCEEGYNKIVFNTLWKSAAINSEGLHGYLIRYNSFVRGGLQEGIADVANEFRYSEVHHNWNVDGKGTRLPPAQIQIAQILN